MHTASADIMAAIAIPTAWQCLAFFSPILLVTVLYALLKRTEQLVEHLFPEWEWEQRLGWLNIQAERQADFIVRWISYVFYSVLAVALYGIVWGAEVVPSIPHWDNPDTLGEIFLRMPALLASLSLFLLYFGVFLIPKLRKQYETEQLEKFNLEQRRLEEERDQQREEIRKADLSNPRFGSFGRTRGLGPKRN